MSRQSLILLAKAAISAGLVAFLVQRVQFGPLIQRLEQIDPLWLALALAVFIGQLLLTGWRYGLIGRAIDAALPMGEAVRLVLIGQFFSQTLPSAIGGDAVRAYMTTRHGIRWGRAVSAVLCDRGVAMVVLMLLATLTIPLFLARIETPWAHWLVPVPGVLLVAGLAALILGDDARLTAVARWRIARPLAILVGDMRRIVLTSRESRTILMISIAVHLGVIASVWLLARSLAIDLAFLDCLVLVPPIVVVTLAPVSIAGWGVREGAMVVGFALVGVAEADALALSVATGLAQIVAGIPGGILWLLRGRPATGGEAAR
jgi:glycosyltransferase 2 family protein